MANKNIGKYGNKFSSENASYYQILSVIKRKENSQRIKDLQEVLLWYLRQKPLERKARDLVRQAFPHISRPQTNDLYFLALVIQKVESGDIKAMKFVLNDLFKIIETTNKGDKKNGKNK